jgi:cyclopropane fatty-acyl-phospholipid synthase-like methyltransferase
VLEIGCGTGEQAVYFAKALPHLTWQPADADSEAIASAAAWRRAANLGNLERPITLDATAKDWDLPTGFAPDALVSVNMVHIAPFAAATGLIDHAGQLLPEDGVLYLYGPFRRGGQHTAPSNAAFDESLRSRNPAWGIRDLEEIAAIAAASHLTHTETIEMPANNLSVVFHKDDAKN